MSDRPLKDEEKSIIVKSKSCFINQLDIVICSSKDLAYLFKLAHKWAKENICKDFIIRLLFILTHISWGFYLDENVSIGAFV